MTPTETLIVTPESVELYARHVELLERLEPLLGTLLWILGAWAAGDLLLGLLQALGASRRARARPGDAQDLARGAAALAAVAPPQGDGGERLERVLAKIAAGPHRPRTFCLECGATWKDLESPSCGSCGSSRASVEAPDLATAPPATPERRRGAGWAAFVGRPTRPGSFGIRPVEPGVGIPESSPSLAPLCGSTIGHGNFCALPLEHAGACLVDTPPPRGGC